MRVIFDLETNGLLKNLDRIHCIWAKDLDTGEVVDFGPDQIDQGVGYLEMADELIGQNIIKFDLPAIAKVYPRFKTRAKITDTLVMSRVIYPDLKERDFAFVKKNPSFPKKLIGRHGLEAWGHRMGVWKGDYSEIKKAEGKAKGLKGPALDEYVWAEWSPEMHEYCNQDIVVTQAHYEKLLSKEPSEESLNLEHAVAHIVWRQEQYGFGFDTDAASELLGRLSERSTVLQRALQSAFPPWEVETEFLPKRNNKTLGYEAGVPFIKRATVEFNPDSRHHIASKLKEKCGWKPTVFTPSGQAQIDEGVLGGLEYPEAKTLEEYLTISKRISQLSTGRQAWLKTQKQGRIYGSVNTGGTITGRMTHSHPNVAQVPANRALWGGECRALFVASPGKVLVGCDADGLEGRCLAGYLARYDGGAFRKVILDGRKEDGTDLHSVNARVLGCSRDDAKTWLYAFIYGAGVAKLGSILHGGNARGSASRAQFLKALPALARLVSGVRGAVASRGYLKGIDGRRLPIRSQHSALNTLLQSAGAVLMKRAQVILDADLTAQGLVPGDDYEFVATVHDEWVLDVRPELAGGVAETAKQAITKAGEYYDFPCPLVGNSQVGRHWGEIH